MTPFPAPDKADDETYWDVVRACYDVSPDFINLENGSFGLQSIPVHEAFMRHNRLLNRENTWFTRHRFPQQLERVMAALTAFCGTADGELLITRNLTEGINILLQGYPFAPGDAVLYACHDYDTVVDTLQMLHKRASLVLQQIALPLDPASDDDIVARYETAITPRTRVLLVTHLIHRSGQILPVAKIATMARRHGVDVIVDAAHSFAQLDYRLPDLGAEFVCANLHKWLGAPLGVGLLYIRKARIAEIAPLFGAVDHAPDDIEKLGNVGTLPPAPILAIEDALAFHNTIGSANKEARLRYLTQYWISRARQIPGVVIGTPDAPERSCAIGVFQLASMPAAQVCARLMSDHAIFTAVRALGDVEVIRVTPHLYTSTSQLDAFVAALRSLAVQAT